MQRREKTLDDFEKRVGMKRTGSDAKKTVTKPPNDILVQRMSPTASGRLKKFEPLDTRDFIPFDEYEELTLTLSNKLVKHFTKLLKTLAMSLPPIEGPPTQNLSSWNVKRFSSSDLFLLVTWELNTKSHPCHLEGPVHRFQSTCQTRHPNQTSHLSPCRLVNYVNLGILLYQRNKIWPP